jgi:hypothetical protein
MVPKISGVKACGTQILVELLTDEEVLGTNIKMVKIVNSNLKGASDTPQAYILDVGPRASDYGFKVGDRIMFSGGFVPAPKFDDSERQRGTIDPNCIKAILVEKVD